MKQILQLLLCQKINQFVIKFMKNLELIKTESIIMKHILITTIMSENESNCHYFTQDEDE